MKTKHLILLLFFCSLLLNSKCKKENEPQLPPETTIGAMTFGCKIDGKVFIPKGTISSPDLISHYYFLGNGPGGGWSLYITAANDVDKPSKTVFIETDSLLLEQGNSYPLKKIKGSAYCRYSSYPLFYQMNNDDTGELFITKHDQVQHILSGRFSFNVSSTTGEKIRITEGRFDVRY